MWRGSWQCGIVAAAARVAWQWRMCVAMCNVCRPLNYSCRLLCPWDSLKQDQWISAKVFPVSLLSLFCLLCTGRVMCFTTGNFVAYTYCQQRGLGVHILFGI